jgi:hypothetical protein
VATHGSLKMTSANRALNFGDTKFFPSPSASPYSKQASPQFLSGSCCSLLVAVNDLRPLDASITVSPNPSVNFTSLWLLPRIRLRFRFLSLFKDVLLPNFQKGGRARDLDHRSSGTRRHLLHHPHELARSA